MNFANLSLIIVCGLICPLNNCRAAIISAESSAYGLSMDLELDIALLPNVTVGLTPQPTISGTAPAAYNLTNSQASANVDGQVDVGGLLGLVNIIDLETMLLEVNANSNVDGLAGIKSTSANATVNDLNLDINNVILLALNNFISLDATLIQSTASLEGDYGALSATGESTISGTHGLSNNQALLTVAGVDFLLDANAAPNTMISINSSVSGLGSFVGNIDVILNEQTLSGDGNSFQSIDVNALRLNFNAVELDLGLISPVSLNGSLTIANSAANMSAVPVPEPSTFLFLSMVGLGGFVSRRRTSVLRHITD